MVFLPSSHRDVLHFSFYSILWRDFRLSQTSERCHSHFVQTKTDHFLCKKMNRQEMLCLKRSPLQDLMPLSLAERGNLACLCMCLGRAAEDNERNQGRYAKRSDGGRHRKSGPRAAGANQWRD